MKKGAVVKITKLGTQPNPLIPIEEHVIPAEYWVKGSLYYDITVGKSMCVIRTERNGIPKLGVFTTSQVKEVENNPLLNYFLVYTVNSIYSVEVLTSEEPDGSLYRQ